MILNVISRVEKLTQIYYSQGRSGVSPKIALMNRYLKNESVSRCRNQSQS